jgi:trimeric autotransporter adhesin
MAERRPLVLIDGTPRELPSGDSLPEDPTLLKDADIGTAVCSQTDPRLSDQRTPTAHKSTHATGGADALSPADIGALAMTVQATFSPGTGPSQVATAGPELLANAGFDSDLTGWTADGWTYASGAALHTTGNVSALSQSVAGIVSGDICQIVITISGRTAGSTSLSLGAAIYGATLTTSGTVALAAASSGTLTFSITPTTDFNGSIDAVSLKRLTPCAALDTVRDSSGAVVIERRGSASLYNTANGYQALRSNTTGGSNTANGYQALLSNTTGGNNTANGVNALRSNTTGGNNTANGRDALLSNTAGGSNTANGYQALLSNTAGGSNTANGYQALRSNTTGGNNTANGVNALRSNTTGGNNTANGANALLSNTTGGSNTANGRDALRYTNNGAAAAAPNNCVAIGYDTRILTESDTNAVVIGHAARGQGSNTVAIGSSAITGNYVYGDIESLSTAAGIILKSPDGTRYKIAVANGGTLTVAPA